jgi:hypothetical protein
LDKVFAAGNIWGVFGIAALLNVLGAIEATFNKSKKRFHNMFPMVLLAMMSSTFPIGVLGSQYAMAERPFWKPNQFVPVRLHDRGIGLAETHSSSPNRSSG